MKVTTPCLSSPENVARHVTPRSNAAPKPAEIGVALLTGGFDKHYTFGLATALAAKGVRLQVVGSDELDSPEMHNAPELRFLNLRGSKRDVSLVAKISRLLIYYVRLVHYAAIAEPQIFHILWNNKFEFLDRTLLMAYYKLCRKKIVFTAHNVNAGKRDANDSLFNRVTLRTQYHLADHVLVHNDKMKRELHQDFGVREQAITVVPYGINNFVPETDLTRLEAKKRLGIRDGERAILFFGAIRPYKGLEYLVEAFLRLAVQNTAYRLIIAGFPHKGSEQYFAGIQRKIDSSIVRSQIIQKIQYIPDEDI